MPAGKTLKARSRETSAPPIREPNIGIKLKIPVMRPNGRARPGVNPKMTESRKTAIAVQPALMRETEMAPVTYFATTSDIRSETLAMRFASGFEWKCLQKRLIMPGPSVSMKRDSTRMRIVAVVILVIVLMDAVRKPPRSFTIFPVTPLMADKSWACVSSMPRLLAKLRLRETELRQ